MTIIENDKFLSLFYWLHLVYVCNKGEGVYKDGDINQLKIFVETVTNQNFLPRHVLTTAALICL